MLLLNDTDIVVYSDLGLLSDKHQNNPHSLQHSEAAIKSAGVREVFTQCDSGSHDTLSSHAQDLEPVHVTVGDDNVAYMLFQVMYLFFSSV